MAKHTIVWIDHKRARIIRLQAEATDDSTIQGQHFIQKHRSDSDATKDQPDDTWQFFQRIAHALADAAWTVLVGPAAARLEFLSYVHRHDPRLESKLIVIDSLEHPLDGQIVEYAQQYFRRGRTPT